MSVDEEESGEHDVLTTTSASSRNSQCFAEEPAAECFPGDPLLILAENSSQSEQEQQSPLSLHYNINNDNIMNNNNDDNNDGWSTQWEDAFADETTTTTSTTSGSSTTIDLVVDSLPPQLHPAVSLGMRRVSSCAYFSLQGSVSEADLFSLSSEYHNATAAGSATESHAVNHSTTTRNSGEQNQQQQQQQQRQVGDANHWLYHDILMHVFTFLDAKSLASFSETALRFNFECFYFLQLQLQRALLLQDNYLNSGLPPLHNSFNNINNDDDRLAAIAGSWTISRLASLDKQEALDVVQEYLDSNSTLRIMPFSHSLAYVRQLLRRHGFTITTGTTSRSTATALAGSQQTTQAFTTSAALVIGLVGAAVMSGNVNAEVVESFGNEIPNMLFKVGFVGSLMGAARHRWENKHKSAAAAAGTTRVDASTSAATQLPTMRETAEQMARTMQELPAQIMERMTTSSSSTTMASSRSTNNDVQNDAPRGTDDTGNENNQLPTDINNNKGRATQPQQDASISRRMYDAFLGTTGRPERYNDIQDQQQQHRSQSPSGANDGAAMMSPNPYEHLPGDAQEKEKRIDDTITTVEPPQESKTTTAKLDNGMTRNSSQQETQSPKMPSGCVGAYFRAIHRASNKITQIVQQQRREKFEALPDRELLARSFIDACCSDDTLDVVIDLVQRRGIIDPAGFYVGSDGTETCALHASAFHGATQVLEFLCGGIDERDASKDQGLCNVDIQDANLWTALHFAAGANCVESARILADRGAKLNVTAANGYTPLQWAQRLSNHEVAEELRHRLEQADPFHSSNHRWMAGASQPLSMIAHRFFALIPTH